MSVIRATIANVDPSAVADVFENNGFAGTVSNGGIGFSDWGREPTVTVEVATDRPLHVVKNVVRTILLDHKEEAAYVTVGGVSPRLWYANGSTEHLD
jgi:hypothetical protein